MKTRSLYLVLCVAGAVIPYLQLVPWVSEHGLNVRLMIQELFANRISAFFALDVIVSTVVLIVFVFVECARRRLRLWWLPILATLCVGVSLGLPLALYLREVEDLRS
jgi:hypothetical protein